MNSGQKVIAKIKELGYPEAEKFFNRTKSALRVWENNPTKVPAWAADLLTYDDDTPGQVESATYESNTLQPVPMPPADISGRIAQLEARMASVEFRLQTPTTTAVVPPKPQPKWTDPHNFNK